MCEILGTGEQLPPEISRPEVAEILMGYYKPDFNLANIEEEKYETRRDCK